jgi:hypothetical protein
LQHILPTQIAINIATTEKSENQLQVLDFIEVHRYKTGFGVELGNSQWPNLSNRYSIQHVFWKFQEPAC